MSSPRPALSGPLHVAWHVVLVVSGWCIFGGFWWLILLQESHRLANIAWLVASALILVPVITLYWVVHNRGIYARKGPRRQVQVVETRYAQDWAGRPVRADFDRLRQVRSISILSSNEEKRFLPVAESSLPPQAS
jgi:hypothetical protein